MNTLQTVLQKAFNLGSYNWFGSELSNVVILVGRVTTSGRCTTLRAVNGSGGTGYVVPAGKTLTIYQIAVICDVRTAQAAVLYADTDVGVNSAAAGTNPVYAGADSTPINIASAQDGPQGNPLIKFQVPTGKYPAVVCTGTSVSVVAFGLLS